MPLGFLDFRLMVMYISDLDDLDVELIFEVRVSELVVERPDSANIRVLGHLFFLGHFQIGMGKFTIMYLSNIGVVVRVKVEFLKPIGGREILSSLCIGRPLRDWVTGL